MAADPGIGHVLKAIAHLQMPADVPVQSSTPGKLTEAPQAGRAKLVPADVSRTGPPFQRRRKFTATQHQSRPGGAHECILVMAAQPARREIHARLQTPITSKVPTPRQPPIRKSFRLVEA